MCFSATASFISGSTLCVVGVATLKQTVSNSERPFAMIPLLFGVQQLIEGVIWLTFSHDFPAVRQVMTYLYSFFSHVLWPIYMPFAILALEAVRWRRKVLFTFEAVGITVGLYLLFYLLSSPVVAEVIGNHIVYVSPHFYVIQMMVFYVAAACVSCFFSSHRFIKIFGALLLISFIVSYIMYIVALVSIWCFFAAILSFVIYFHFRFTDRSAGNNVPLVLPLSDSIIIA